MRGSDTITFSVIIPFYNVEKYARKCIESVLNQTYGEFELILVDDGSTDSCPEILDEYARIDSRIIVIHQPNGGLVSARKAGAKCAVGEYVVIVDGDDWIDEKLLQVFKESIDTSKADLICCKYNKVDDNGLLCAGKDRQDPLVGYYAREKMCCVIKNLFALRPHVWSKAFKREMYQELQLSVDNRIKMGEDGVVTYPFYCRANSVLFLNEKLYYYRSNPNSMTNTKRKFIEWENSSLKVELYEKTLPFDIDGVAEQFAGYVVHSYFNVIVSHFQNCRYRDVCQDAREKLQNGRIVEYLKMKPIYNNKKEMLARFALKYRLFPLIKLYSILK